MDGVEPVMGDVPALGQHTDAVLQEVGVARDTIAAWRKGGVI
jgi:crotonobetainyl-CoA:carnitine CoA-transferase CaiB-like acyl-CoA transferase